MYVFEEMISRIKSIKKLNKISNDELAQLSNVPKSTLSKILSGQTKDPQISSIISIAQALGVSADFIVFGKTMLSSSSITKNEIELLDAYRSKPEMQAAVNTLLGLPAPGSQDLAQDAAATADALSRNRNLTGKR